MRSPGHDIANATSEPRTERIQGLAAKLLDSTVLNTAQSRARCRQLAVSMLQLLDEEDGCQSRLEPAVEHDQIQRRRFMWAVRAFRDTVEQAAVSRLYVVSQRWQRRQEKQGTRSG